MATWDVSGILVDRAGNRVVNERSAGINIVKEMEKQEDGRLFLIMDAATYKAFEECLSIEKKDDFFLVKTNKNTYEGKKLIYAAGSHLKELDMDYKGFEVKHWPYGNEESLKGKTVIVNGGSDGASKEGILYFG